MPDNLVIAGRAFKSRLIVGTGKYRSFQEMARAHAASGADMVTVAVRRVNLTDKSKESRSEEHTSELQSQSNLVCRLLLEKKKKNFKSHSVHQSRRIPTDRLLYHLSHR